MRRIAVTIAGLLFASLSWGQFTPGNLLVSEAGSGTRVIKEYTSSGVLLRTISVPVLTGHTSIDHNRGMAIDYLGRLHVFNGTHNNVSLSTYDPVLDTWSNLSIPGLSLSNNLTYGKIACYGDYVFLPDHQTSGSGSPKGLIRVDTRDNSWVRFAGGGGVSDGSIDLNIGADGMLYSLNGMGSPSGRGIAVYHPEYLGLQRTLNLSHISWHPEGGSVRNAVARYDGKLWLVKLFSPAFLIDLQGNIVSLNKFASFQIMDFDISSEGQLVQVDRRGGVHTFDSSYSHITSFSTSTSSISSSFVSFVPEPGTYVWPHDVTLVRGASLGGWTDELLISDDRKLTASAWISLLAGESPLQIEVHGDSPIADPGEIRFKLEASVSTPSLTQTLEMFNYVTGMYEEIDFWVGTPTDSIVEVVITTDPGRYVQNGTGAMMAKISYKQTGITLNWPWSAGLDHAIWRVIP